MSSRGNLSATPLGVEAGDAGQYFRTGRAPEVVLDALGGRVIGPAGDDLNATGNLGMQPAEIHPADREHFGEAGDEAAEIRVARAVRAIGETSQCVSDPIMAERSGIHGAES